MEYHPVPDRLNPASSTAGESGTQPCDVTAPAAVAKFESNLTEIAARFVAQSGGGLSPELSADLALEIVLNEIAEQACLATRATGAAIVLRGAREMVCRASSGETAPGLGVRFDIASGLSRLCIETGHVQRCDDAHTDLRADAETCRRLDVRSVMVLPLVRDADVVGLFEVFSSRPSTFGERDEHTLEALSLRVLKNLDLAAEPLPELIEVPRITYPLGEDSQANSEPGHEVHYSSVVPSLAPLLVEETSETPSGYRFDFVTGALGGAVLACAVLLTVLVAQRLAGHNAGRNPMAGQGGARSASGDVRSAHASLPDAASKAVVRTNELSTPGASREGHAVPAKIRRKDAASQLGTSALSSSNDSSRSEGGLRVYENGKEIFRMSPNVGEGELPLDTGEAAVRHASAIEPARILELSPAAAEGSLLHRVEPEYPEEARQQQIQGLVVLDVRISRDGKVENLKLVKGERLLADAAIAAVKLWRFNPRRVNGQPTEMQTTVTLNFRLPPQPKM